MRLIGAVVAATDSVSFGQIGDLEFKVQRLYLIKFAPTYIDETLGNVSGGLKQGSVYEGATKPRRRRDLQKLMGLEQLTFHANADSLDDDRLFREVPVPGLAAAKWTA